MGSRAFLRVLIIKIFVDKRQGSMMKKKKNTMPVKTLLLRSRTYICSFTRF